MKQAIYSAVCALTAVTLVVVTPGCSIFAPTTEDVTIDSDPQGAEIIIPGKARCTTPATVSLPCDHDVTIIIKKDGYYTHVHNINRTIGKCGILDVVGAYVFLLPAIGLFFPGSHTLEQHTVYASLIEKNRSEELHGGTMPWITDIAWFGSLATGANGNSSAVGSVR